MPTRPESFYLSRTALPLALLGLLGVLSASLPAPARQQPAAPPTAAALAAETDDELARVLLGLSPDEQVYHQHITTQTNPFFEGRAPGLRGNQLAAEYVEFCFRKMGLQPGMPTIDKAADGTETRTANTTFRQPFGAGTEVKATVAKATINGSSLTPGTDFNVLGTSGSGAAEGPVVFVGYALEKGENGYATFGEGEINKQQLAGKIALVLRYEPMDEQGKARWNAGGGWGPASSLRPKLMALQKRGAAAIIMVSPPGANDPNVGKLEDARSTRQGQALTIPLVMVTQQRAGELVKAAGKSLMELRHAADEKGELLDLPNTRVSIEAAVAREPVKTDNVCAVLPGRGDLADQFLIIGAHYDHVGYGYFGSRAGSRGSGVLHPGADDNASGTSGLLLTASKLRAAYAKLPENATARSVMFVAFSAEESGLVGSRFFVRNPPVAAKQIYAMLNMDMIGRVRYNKIDIGGTGTAEGFAELLAPLFAASGMNIRSLPGGQGPSDHASFFAASVPVLHFFTGLSDQYHMPEDTYVTINTSGAVRVVNMVTAIATMLAQRSEPLVFTNPKGPSIIYDTPKPDGDGAEPTNGATSKPAAAATPTSPAAQPMRPTSPADPNAPAASGPGMGGVKVRFGIAPDNYDDDKPGILVGDVFPNTSAAEAGIKKGDRILKWNDKVIKSFEDWMPLLAAAKPGDKVELTVQRGEQTLKTTTTLRAREPSDK